MKDNLKYNAWYSGQHLGKFETVEESQNCIAYHEAYTKSKFTARGRASSRNENQKEYFAIYDTEGYGWNIK